MRNLLDKFYLGCGVCAAASLLAMMLLITAQIVARLSHGNIPSSDDVSGYMVAWSTFMGLAYAMRHDDHIRVDLFVKMLPKAPQRALGIFVHLAAFALIACFCFYVFLLVKESYDFGDLTSGYVAIPLWWVQAPFLAGVFALLVSVADRLAGQIFNLNKEASQ